MLAMLMGQSWEERKGLRGGTAADPGLQEPLSKQVRGLAVGQSPTSGGCGDNIDPTSLPRPATAIGAADGRYQQAFWRQHVDRSPIGLPRHLAGQPLQSLSPSA